MVATRRLFSRGPALSWLWVPRRVRRCLGTKDPKQLQLISFQRTAFWSIHSTVSLKGLTIPLMLPSPSVQTYWSAYAQMCHRLGPVVAHPVFRVTDAPELIHGQFWVEELNLRPAVQLGRAHV